MHCIRFLHCAAHFIYAFVFCSSLSVHSHNLFIPLARRSLPTARPAICRLYPPPPTLALKQENGGFALVQGKVTFALQPCKCCMMSNRGPVLIGVLSSVLPGQTIGPVYLCSLLSPFPRPMQFWPSTPKGICTGRHGVVGICGGFGSGNRAFLADAVPTSLVGRLLDFAPPSGRAKPKWEGTSSSCWTELTALPTGLLGLPRFPG